MGQKKIRVLSIGHSYVVAMNRAILREVAEHPDFEVTIGAPSFFHGSLRSLEIEPEPADSKLKVVPLRCHLTQKMHVFFYNPWDLNALVKQGFDCAHIWEEPYIVAGYQVMRRLHKQQIPFLFRTAQSLIKNYIPPFRQMDRWCFTHAKHFVAGGNLVLKAMQDKGWELPGEVITLAVDTKAFRPFTPEEKVKKQKELGLKGPLIGYLGRLSEEKGCDLFMSVLGQLKHKDWSFLVMGSGPYQQKILDWAKREGLSERVKVALFKHDEVPQVLPACDLLIAPSQTRPFWKEQFGRMIVEAFASGVPFMGSDSGEIPRVIGNAGWVLPEADEKAWLNAINDFLANPDTGAEYVRRGLEKAPQFGAENIGRKYQQVYRELHKVPGTQW